MNRQIETAAVRAHRNGTGWNDFYRRHKAAIDAAEPAMVRKLVALVASGDTHGAVPIANGWSEPMPFEIDGSAPPVPAYPQSDDETVARCRWEPQEAS